MPESDEPFDVALVETSHRFRTSRSCASDISKQYPRAEHELPQVGVPPTTTIANTIDAIFIAVERLGGSAQTGDPELTRIVALELAVSNDEAAARIYAAEDWMQLRHEQLRGLRRDPNSYEGQ